MTKFLFGIFIFTVILCPPAFGQKASGTPGAVEPISVSYGIVVDNSGSYRSLLDKVINIVKDVAEENRADDETFLVSFVDSNKVRLLQDFTSSKEAINEATDEMFIEGGQTAIVDAVAFSARHLAEKSPKVANRSRVLLLITDGDERESVTKLDSAIQFLKTEGITVYTIGLADGKVYVKLLDKLAKETGGKVYLPKTKAELTAAIKEFSSAIRTKPGNVK